MAKQMEGDNKQHRNDAREARRDGAAASERGVRIGGSTHTGGAAPGDHETERPASVRHGEVKRDGDDVLRPLRGKDRRSEPETPPRHG